MKLIEPKILLTKKETYSYINYLQASVIFKKYAPSIHVKY